MNGCATSKIFHVLKDGAEIASEATEFFEDGSFSIGSSSADSTPVLERVNSQAGVCAHVGCVYFSSAWPSITMALTLHIYYNSYSTVQVFR